jgi:hypothetical protein
MAEEVDLDTKIKASLCYAAAIRIASMNFLHFST